MDPDLKDSEPSPSLEDVLQDAIGLTEDESVDAAASVETAPESAPAVEKPAEPEAPAVQAPEAAEQKPDAAKAADAELYAPLPEHNPRKTHERFAKLVEGHKAVSQERDSAVQEREQLRSRIEEYETGLQPLREMGFNTPEAVADLQQFSRYRNALATGNVDAAISLLQEQARQLALATGRSIDFDPLANFPELSSRVQSGEMDQATAIELARGRHVSQVQHQNLQRQRQEQTQQHQAVEAVHNAARSVDQVVLQLMKDPDYQKVEPALMQNLQFIKDSYPPHLWPQEVKRAYEYEARVLKAQAQAQQIQRTPQPIRANGHGGGMPAPRSASEAVLQSLGLE